MYMPTRYACPPGFVYRQRASPLPSGSRFPASAHLPKTRCPRISCTRHPWRLPRARVAPFPPPVRGDDSRSRCASHGHLVNLDRGNPNAYRHALAFFAANPDTLVQRQIVTYHADVAQRLRSVADERGVAHRPRQPAILDQVTLRSREYEVAARDIHLPATEI